MKEVKDFSGVTHYTHVEVQPGGINIQNVEHLYQADVLRQMGIELKVKQGKSNGSANPEMVEKLVHDELWLRLVSEGLIDAEGQPAVSRPEAAIMADILAQRIRLENKWKFFEQLWNRNHMRNDYNTALNQRKTLDFQDRLKRIIG